MHTIPFRRPLRRSFRHGLALAALFLVISSLQASEWEHRTAHDFALSLPSEQSLADQIQVIRPSWSHAIHTGIGKAGSGTATDILEQGYEPTFGDTASAVVADGVYLLSWSEATGSVVARPESVTDRYYRGEENYARLAETAFRIDANWNTIALDAATGEKLWQVSEPSASMNFVSSKRGHNGIDPAAGNGVYVTTTITGRIFAYDIRSGEKRWEAHVGQWHEAAEAFKAEALEERTIPGVSSGMFGFIRPGLVVVDAVAVVPDLRGGLIGLDIENGQERWRIAEPVNNRQGSPRLWQHAGSTYLLTHQNRGGDTVSLINPRDGSILWTQETGYNPGDLIMGEGMVLLNPSGSRRDGIRLSAYRITLEGLQEEWQFPDDDRYRYPARGDRKAERRGLIDDGRLYMAIGFPKQQRRLAVYDLASGSELYSGETGFNDNAGHPVSYGDKLYWQVDSSHSGESGIYVYHKNSDGSLDYLGEVNYRSLGVNLLIDYEYPIEVPYANGHLFLRGRSNLAAINLQKPVIPPAQVQLAGAWAGYVRPVSAVWVAGADGTIELGRVEVPIRRELGVPGTTARRIDVWDRFTFDESPSLGAAWEGSATIHMASFSWPARIVMQEAQGSQWSGQWIRSFAGWEEPLNLEGAVHESSSGGYPRRGWPTPWLDDRPISFYSDLPDGQERVILQLHSALPHHEGDRRNVTICIDHDGNSIAAAVAGAFSYNQSYHEVDASQLQISPEGISGQAMLILNGDLWMRDPDWKNGGSLLGQLNLDVQFGERDGQGVHPVSGTWSIEWGKSGELSGPIHATLGE